jgi:tRNA pseudouridine38-40 synthase
VLLRVTAHHFLRRQVRRMVGAAVDCATGRTEPARLLRDVERPSEAATLHWAERAAPASGLFLESVRYPGDPEPWPLAPAFAVR